MFCLCFSVVEIKRIHWSYLTIFFLNKKKIGEEEREIKRKKETVHEMLCILRGRFGGTSSGWLGTWSPGVSCVFMERKEWSLFWRVGVSGEVEIFIVKFSKSTLFICSSFYFLFFIKSFVFQFVAMPYWNECNRFSKLIKFFILFFLYLLLAWSMVWGGHP